MGEKSEDGIAASEHHLNCYSLVEVSKLLAIAIKAIDEEALQYKLGHVEVEEGKVLKVSAADIKHLEPMGVR